MAACGSGATEPPDGQGGGAAAGACAGGITDAQGNPVTTGDAAADACIAALIGDAATVAALVSTVAAACDGVAVDLGGQPSGADNAEQACQATDSAIGAVIAANPQTSYDCMAAVDCAQASAAVPCSTMGNPSVEMDQLVAALGTQLPALLVACCQLSALGDGATGHLDCALLAGQVDESCAVPLADAVEELVAQLEGLASACVSAAPWAP
jgi:hypothetical protein